MENYIITIARGYGSGGSHIAKAVAEKLQIPCYDNEILERASNLSGINESYFYQANEKIHRGILPISSKGVYTGSIYSVNDRQYLSNENLFNYQALVIRNLALEDKQSCIIVGKAANYILKSLKNVIKINIQAPQEYCIGNITKRLVKSEYEAAEMIQKTNKYRSDYYQYYTGRNWYDPSEYDICLNTASLGENYAADLIVKLVKDRMG